MELICDTEKVSCRGGNTSPKGLAFTSLYLKSRIVWGKKAAGIEFCLKDASSQKKINK
jgi:hypothetical protein